MNEPAKMELSIINFDSEILVFRRFYASHCQWMENKISNWRWVMSACYWMTSFAPRLNGWWSKAFSHWIWRSGHFQPNLILDFQRKFMFREEFSRKKFELSSCKICSQNQETTDATTDTHFHVRIVLQHIQRKYLFKCRLIHTAEQLQMLTQLYLA